MILPPDMLCAKVIVELLAHDEQTHELTEWERSFCISNRTRSFFTDKQKECVRTFATKYDLDCTKGLPK